MDSLTSAGIEPILYSPLATSFFLASAEDNGDESSYTRDLSISVYEGGPPNSVRSLYSFYRQAGGASEVGQKQVSFKP